MSPRRIALVTDLNQMRADDALIDRLGSGSPPGDDPLCLVLAAWGSACVRGFDGPPPIPVGPSRRSERARHGVGRHAG